MIYEFMPTQSYNGYDQPWGPGAGKNKFGLSDGSVTIGGLAIAIKNEQYSFNGKTTGEISAGNANWKTFGYCTLPAGSYKARAYGETVAQGSSLGAYLENYDTTTAISTLPLSVSTPVTFEADTDIYMAFYVYNFDGTADRKFSVYKSTETLTEWSPYINNCMPEGFNIWDPDNDEFIQVYAGYVNSNTRELYLRPVYQEYAGEELVGPWMSSLDLYAEDTTPTEGAFVIDFGGELTSFEITPFMLQTLLDSLGIRQHFTDGAGLLNKLMDQAQGRVRSEEELLHLSRPLNVIAIGDQLPAGLTFKPISKDVLPGLPGKFIR